MAEAHEPDPFVGTWTLNREKSVFDANHNPQGGTMVFERDAEGGYLMTAQGIAADGRTVAERPQRFVTDGVPRPLPDLPGLQTVATRPWPHALRGEVRRQDGSLVGQGEYVVSPDGATLTATAAGFDSQLRRFEVTTVWDRRRGGTG